jgi:hypothetical protein
MNFSMMARKIAKNSFKFVLQAFFQQLGVTTHRTARVDCTLMYVAWVIL